MSIELKQAAEKALVVLGSATSFMSRKARDQHESVVAELRTAIQQAESEPVAFGIRESSTGRICQFVSSDDEDEVAQLGEYRKGIVAPLYTHPAPGVPEFSRIAKRKLDELQEQGFAITGYAIQRAAVRGFIDGGGFVGWWQGEPAPGVPDEFEKLIKDKIKSVKEANPGRNGRMNQAVLFAIGLLEDMLTAAQAQKGQP